MWSLRIFDKNVVGFVRFVKKSLSIIENISKIYFSVYSKYTDSPYLYCNKSYYIILIQYSWFEIDTYNKYIHLFKQKKKDFSCPQYSSSIPSFQFIQLHGNSIFIWKSDRHNNNNKNRKKVAYQDEEFI